jgi:hypothetical protein
MKDDMLNLKLELFSGNMTNISGKSYEIFIDILFIFGAVNGNNV